MPLSIESVVEPVQTLKNSDCKVESFVGAVLIQ